MSRLDDLLATKEKRWRDAKSDHFGARLALGHAHELCAQEKVRLAGWVCDRWGQALLTDEMRQALKSTESPVRWAPDLLAVRGTDWCFIDGKAEISRGTGNFSIEKSALASHFSWWVNNMKGPAHFVYVWDDFRCSHISEIGPLANTGRLRTGSWNGCGSKTSFWLIPKDVTRPFDDLFGKTAFKVATCNTRAAT